MNSLYTYNCSSHKTIVKRKYTIFFIMVDWRFNFFMQSWNIFFHFSFQYFLFFLHVEFIYNKIIHKNNYNLMYCNIDYLYFQDSLVLKMFPVSAIINVCILVDIYVNFIFKTKHLLFYNNNNKPNASPLRGTSNMETYLNSNCTHIHSRTRNHTNKSQNQKFQSPANSDFPKSSSTPAGVIRFYYSNFKQKCVTTKYGEVIYWKPLVRLIAYFRDSFRAIEPPLYQFWSRF